MLTSTKILSCYRAPHEGPTPNYVFKPTAEEALRFNHSPSRGGGLTRSLGSSQMKRWKVVAVSLAIGVVGIGAHRWNISQPLAFDRAVWLTGDNNTSMNPPRLRMADDLVEKQVALGKTRAEIESLLGPPTQTNYFRNYDMVYWLGPERSGYGVDSEWLVVRISEGRANEAKIVHD
jgi:hypothetical protein